MSKRNPGQWGKRSGRMARNGRTDFAGWQSNRDKQVAHRQQQIGAGPSDAQVQQALIEQFNRRAK